MNLFDKEEALLNKCISLWEENEENLPLLLRFPTWNYKDNLLSRFLFLSKVINLGRKSEILKPYVEDYLNSRYIPFAEEI